MYQYVFGFSGAFGRLWRYGSARSAGSDDGDNDRD